MMTPIERVSIKSQALAILGLNSTTATEEDIRLAYRSRVREKHPDRCNGQAGEFLRITDAYNFLCGEVDDFDPKVAREDMNSDTETERPISRTPRPTMDFTPKPRVRSKTMSRPVSKPMVRETETVLSDSVKKACETLLDDGSGLLATHQKRAGRKLAYTVPVKMLENVNKVVVPTGDLFDLRRMTPVALTISASDISGGSYLVPTDILEAHFSGARHVEIRFVADL